MRYTDLSMDKVFTHGFINLWIPIMLEVGRQQLSRLQMRVAQAAAYRFQGTHALIAMQSRFDCSLEAWTLFFTRPNPLHSLFIKGHQHLMQEPASCKNALGLTVIIQYQAQNNGGVSYVSYVCPTCLLCVFYATAAQLQERSARSSCDQPVSNTKH